MIRLSICIPTYNFGGFIAETLDSILSQINSDEVEVLVVDGASTDNTSDVVQSMLLQYPQLKYYRLEKKGGIDADMAKSINLATGDYCWLFSSDDLMMPGALSKILREINIGYDVYLCKHLNCSLDMRHIINEHPVLNLEEDAIFDFSKLQDRSRYFELAQTTEAFFSFMSSIIIKREKLESVRLNERFVGSCWAHVARIFELMKTGFTLKYLAQPYLKKRYGNDSFADKGLVHRLRIGIDGYHKLGDIFFGHQSVESFHLRRAVRNEIPLRMFIHTRLLCRENPALEDEELLNSLVRKTYEDDLLNYMIYRILPSSFYTAMRSVYKYVRAKLVIRS